MSAEYEAGYRAYLGGVPFNEYEHQHWLVGWGDARWAECCAKAESLLIEREAFMLRARLEPATWQPSDLFYLRGNGTWMLESW